MEDLKKLRELATWYREFAEKAGSTTIWDARLRTAEDLDQEIARREEPRLKFPSTPPNEESPAVADEWLTGGSPARVVPSSIERISEHNGRQRTQGESMRAQTSCDRTFSPYRTNSCIGLSRPLEGSKCIFQRDVGDGEHSESCSPNGFIGSKPASSVDLGSAGPVKTAAVGRF